MAHHVDHSHLAHAHAHHAGHIGHEFGHAGHGLHQAHPDGLPLGLKIHTGLGMPHQPSLAIHATSAPAHMMHGPVADLHSHANAGYYPGMPHPPHAPLIGHGMETHVINGNGIPTHVDPAVMHGPFHHTPGLLGGSSHIPGTHNDTIFSTNGANGPTGSIYGQGGYGHHGGSFCGGGETSFQVGHGGSISVGGGTCVDTHGHIGGTEGHVGFSIPFGGPH